MIIKKLIFVFTTLALLNACTTPPRKEFDDTQKIQTLAFTNKQYFYAQNDVFLDMDSLDKKLSTKNPVWESKLSSANNYEKLAYLTVLLQFVALGVCLGQESGGETLAWCGGSVGLGLISFPLSNKVSRLRHEVVQEYNGQPH